MKLREKVFVIIGIISAISIIPIYLGSKYVIEKSYLKLEQESAHENLQRVNQAVDQLGKSVDISTSNLSTWDDTYKFVIDKNPTYIKVNLIPASFSAADVDMMLFFNAEGKPTYTIEMSRNRNVQL